MVIPVCFYSTNIVNFVEIQLHIQLYHSIWIDNKILEEHVAPICKVLLVFVQVDTNTILPLKVLLPLYTYRKAGADPGDGLWWSGCPFFGGPWNFTKRDKTTHEPARRHYVLVLNSYLGPLLQNPVYTPE